MSSTAGGGGVKPVLVGAAVWAVASLVLGLVIGRWIRGADTDDCRCGSCALTRELRERLES